MINKSTRGFDLSFFLLILLSSSTSVFGQSEAVSETVVVQKTPNLSQLVREIIIEVTKEGHTDEKHWNKTITRFDGLKFDGLKISKRKKKVRHGFCRKYSAELNNPEQTFSIEIQEVAIPNEDVTAYSINAKLKARCKGTFAHYTYGVKGLNGTMISDADIEARLIVSFDPRAKFSLSAPIPRLQLNAKVHAVDFWLRDVDVRRVGVLEGKLVEVMGDGLEEVLEEFLQSQESRVKKKLQKELDKIQGVSTDKDKSTLVNENNLLTK